MNLYQFHLLKKNDFQIPHHPKSIHKTIRIYVDFSYHSNRLDLLHYFKQQYFHDEIPMKIRLFAFDSILHLTQFDHYVSCIHQLLFPFDRIHVHLHNFFFRFRIGSI